ncbi:Replicase polyprotein 1ab [Krasilnikovia sp. M28-CT-15]|uniref:Replicase polyprotein 1ab n=1 Tax=Krasilnikovia sp. M28-CT-15 TaxID=3373540 RepID=UPI003876FA3C
MRAELLSLSRDVADRVARHLVAAGQIIDEDSDLALQHAIAARRLASRIAAVREAVGLAAYAAGDWATAISELRTYHRMSGRQTHLAELADCERALGRPERAIDLYRGADREALDKPGAIELLIVAAGARSDLGQHDAAVAMLQVRELTGDGEAEWVPRLRYAYADALLAAGRRDEAREWFARAASADEDGLTDAAERLLELDGVDFADDGEDDQDSEDDRDGADGEQPRAEDDTDDLDEDEDEDEDEDVEDVEDVEPEGFLDDDEPGLDPEEFDDDPEAVDESAGGRGGTDGGRRDEQKTLDDEFVVTNDEDGDDGRAKA